MGETILQGNVVAGVHIHTVQRDAEVQVVTGGNTGTAGGTNILTGTDMLTGADTDVYKAVEALQAGDKVDIDLFIIVEYGISISAVAASIIETVKYKVERLAGVPVGRVNVCVEDIRV